MNIPMTSFAWVDPSSEQFEEKLLLHVLSGSKNWAPLIAPDVVRETAATLANIKRDFETKLSEMGTARSVKQAECWARGAAGKSDWFAYELDYKIKRGDLVRQKQAVDAAIAIVKPRVIELNISDSARATKTYAEAMSVDGEPAVLRRLLFDLVTAVSEHKQSIEHSSNVPTVSDRALWSALARLHYPTRGGEMPLREWFARAVR